MRRVPESELQTEFEKAVPWSEDEKYYYYSDRRKSAVLAYFTRLQLVLELAKTNATGPRIGDFACAQGNFGLLLAEAGFDVTAVDIKEEFIRYARKKYTHGAFNTCLANIIEFRSREPFHCIILGEVIEHVATPDPLLRSAYENLLPGGVLILTTPNGAAYGQRLPTYNEVGNLSALIPRQFHWGDHLFLYTPDEIRGLLERSGFDVLQLHKINSSYVHELKGIRYLMPLALLEWLERNTRDWKKGGKDSAGNLVLLARKKAPAHF